MKFNFGKEKKDQAKLDELKRDLARAHLRIKDLEDELSARYQYTVGPGKPQAIDPIRELLAQNYRPDMRAFVLDERDAVLHRLIPEKTAVKFKITVEDKDAIRSFLKVREATDRLKHGIQPIIFKQDPNQWKKRFIVKEGKAENIDLDHDRR